MSKTGYIINRLTDKVTAIVRGDSYDEIHAYYGTNFNMAAFYLSMHLGPMVDLSAAAERVDLTDFKKSSTLLNAAKENESPVRLKARTIKMTEVIKLVQKHNRHSEFMWCNNECMRTESLFKMAKDSLEALGADFTMPANELKVSGKSGMIIHSPFGHLAVAAEE